MATNKLIALIIGAIIVGAGAATLLLRNSPATTNQSANQSSSGQASATSLDYSGRGLTSFPKEILSMTSATSLNISQNNLTGALPAEIKNLSNLQSLDVSYNNMTGIPAEVGQLHNLKTLNYSYNQITGLPMELGNLTQLQTLDLRGNPKVSQQDLSKIRANLTQTDIKL